MKKYLEFKEHSRGVGSEGWYKLLTPIQKKSFILDCISEFVVVRTPEEKEKGVYFYQIMDFFHNKIGVKPYAPYISEMFKDKFGAQSVKDHTGKTMYVGVMLKCEIDFNKLHEIKEGYKTMEKTLMGKDLKLKYYREKAREEIGSDGWYKLLGSIQKKSLILDCISEFVVVRTPEEKEKGVYFYQIMDLFHNKIGVKPYAPYISEIFKDKFGAQSVKDDTGKTMYVGVMLRLRYKTDDLDRLYAIRKKYMALGYKNRNYSFRDSYFLH